MTRLSTGLQKLDEALGGGLLPGSMTMLIGATGIGKTQFGAHFSESGISAEGLRGAIVDLSSRGDSQNHDGYSQRMFGESLSVRAVDATTDESPFVAGRPADMFPFLGYGGRRVLRSQMDTDQWHSWQSEMNRRMPQLFRFVYGHLVHNTRRFLIDGIEPLESSSDSLQLDLVELIYHRMLKQEHDWLAREVLREKYLENAQAVANHSYDHNEAAALVLVTTKQSMLDQLIAEPMADGDLAAGANTVILLGRRLEGSSMKRSLYIVKHRGSYADQRVIEFDIDDDGIQMA